MRALLGFSVYREYLKLTNLIHYKQGSTDDKFNFLIEWYWWNTNIIFFIYQLIPITNTDIISFIYEPSYQLIPITDTAGTGLSAILINRPIPIIISVYPWLQVWILYKSFSQAVSKSKVCDLNKHWHEGHREFKCELLKHRIWRNTFMQFMKITNT